MDYKPATKTFSTCDGWVFFGSLRSRNISKIKFYIITYRIARFNLQIFLSSLSVPTFLGIIHVIYLGILFLMWLCHMLCIFNARTILLLYVYQNLDHGPANSFMHFFPANYLVNPLIIFGWIFLLLRFVQIGQLLQIVSRDNPFV